MLSWASGIGDRCHSEKAEELVLSPGSNAGAHSFAQGRRQWLESPWTPPGSYSQLGLWHCPHVA